MSQADKHSTEIWQRTVKRRKDAENAADADAEFLKHKRIKLEAEESETEVKQTDRFSSEIKTTSRQQENERRENAVDTTIIDAENLKIKRERTISETETIISLSIIKEEVDFEAESISSIKTKPGEDQTENRTEEGTLDKTKESNGRTDPITNTESKRIVSKIIPHVTVQIIKTDDISVRMESLRERLKAKERLLRENLEKRKERLREMKEIRERIEKLREEERNIRTEEIQIDISNESNYEEDWRELITNKTEVGESAPVIRRDIQVYTPEYIQKMENSQRETDEMEQNSMEEEDDTKTITIEDIKITGSKSKKCVGSMSVKIKIQLNKKNEEDEVFKIKGTISKDKRKLNITMIEKSDSEEEKEAKKKDATSKQNDFTTDQSTDIMKVSSSKRTDNQTIAEMERQKGGEVKSEVAKVALKIPVEQKGKKPGPRCSKMLGHKARKSIPRHPMEIQQDITQKSPVEQKGKKPGPRSSKMLGHKARKSIPRRPMEIQQDITQKSRQSTEKGRRQTAKATAKAAMIKRNKAIKASARAIVDTYTAEEVARLKNLALIKLIKLNLKRVRSDGAPKGHARKYIVTEVRLTDEMSAEIRDKPKEPTEMETTVREKENENEKGEAMEIEIAASQAQEKMIAEANAAARMKQEMSAEIRDKPKEPTEMETTVREKENENEKGEAMEIEIAASQGLEKMIAEANAAARMKQ